MTYDNSNSGSLNHERDKKSDRSPDFWGSLQVSGEVLDALIAGKRIRLTGWNRSGRNGDFISLKAELERERQAEKRPSEAGGGGYGWSDAERAEMARKQAGTIEGNLARNAEFVDDEEIPF